MRLWLTLVCVLYALLSRVCLSSIVIGQDFQATSDDMVQINDNMAPTNFSLARMEVSKVALTAVPAVSTSRGAQESVLVKSLISSASEAPTAGKVSIVGVVTPTSKASELNSRKAAMSTSQVMPAAPTTTIPPPGSYTPPPHSVTSSPNSHSRSSQSSGYTPPSISSTSSSTSCAPPVTVTINGPYCTTTPMPAAACSSDCSAKIALSLGISIPGTAILTFLLTALSCLCCQRVKKKQSYIQLAPTVYFDEDEHD